MESLHHQSDAADARLYGEGFRRQHFRRNGHRSDGKLPVHGNAGVERGHGRRPSVTSAMEEEVGGGLLAAPQTARHCERSEAIQEFLNQDSLDCFVALLLAMTEKMLLPGLEFQTAHLLKHTSATPPLAREVLSCGFAPSKC